MKLYVVKKDGTREIFNVEKIINAVNKSAGKNFVQILGG